MTCTDLRTIYVDGLPDPFSVPCGKCIPCLVNKRSDWGFRLEQEHKVSKSAHFVTLTYDQKHMPSDGYLVKRHLQLYLKRLRKRDGKNNIRYYAVGEYGSKSGRPHYHLLLFNAKESDIRASWCDHRGTPVGIVHVGSVAPASVAYVTKYIVQPEEKVKGKQPPFATMSRGYAIGGHYLTDEMVQWHRDNDANYVIRPGGIKSRLPRFYREKIWPSIKKNEKATRAIVKVQDDMKWFKTKDRQRISSAAMALTLGNQKLERELYQKKRPNDWEQAMAIARNLVISRIKKKVAFTQTI